ncbi:DUF1674 domain-containing protein [Leptospira interrogans serovar Pomona]|nr:DUF1674 domain-containing protein [Leptospira interrogans serovar Pomona]
MAQRLGRQPGRPGLFGHWQRAQAAGLVRQGPPVAHALDQSQCALARHIAARLCQNAFLCLSDVQHCSATPYAHSEDLSRSEDPPARPAAARRARAEAEAGRKQQAGQILPVEYGGRDGPEPVRYGDWEKGGIAVDF